MQRNKMILATVSAVLLTSAIVGASYLLIPTQSFSSQTLSSQTFAIILETSFFVAVAVMIGIMLAIRRRSNSKRS